MGDFYEPLYLSKTQYRERDAGSKTLAKALAAPTDEEDPKIKGEDPSFSKHVQHDNMFAQGEPLTPAENKQSVSGVYKDFYTL